MTETNKDIDEQHSNGNERHIHLTNAYKYGGEQTKEIPILDARDHGGAILVHCPDDSTRIFSKDEVRSIEPETDLSEVGE